MKKNPYASTGIPKKMGTLKDYLKTVKEDARKTKHEPDYIYFLASEKERQ